MPPQTAMAVTRILRHDGIGETLAVAYFGDTPVSIHAEGWDGEDRLWLGQRVEARLRQRLGPGQGAFLETDGGDDAFMARAPKSSVPLGQTMEVLVIAEARQDKCAKVVETAGKSAVARGEQMRHPATAFDGWVETLPGGLAAVVEPPDDPDGLFAVLDAALSPAIPLSGGGRLTVERTRALTAADVDVAGRQDRGRAADCSAAVNAAAAHALGRRLSLTGLGGLVVLDCVGPVTPPQKRAVKDALITAFRQGSRRRISALAPSPFGLLEASVAWGACPLGEVFLDPGGEKRPRTVMLEGFRALEREARQRPAAELVLALPEAAFASYRAQAVTFANALNKRYGARFTIKAHERPNPEISHGPC